jgi:hypothetical protein
MKSIVSSTLALSFFKTKKWSLVVLVVFLFTNMEMLGQNKPISMSFSNGLKQPVTTIVAKAIVFESDVDFLNWFIGTKQSQSIFETTLREGSSSTSTTKKKQIMTSGIAPNKVLYRTFIKKIISLESTVV